MLSPEADGTNMVGEVHIPNPTVLTVEMVGNPLKSLRLDMCFPLLIILYHT